MNKSSIGCVADRPAARIGNRIKYTVHLGINLFSIFLLKTKRIMDMNVLYVSVIKTSSILCSVHLLEFSLFFTSFVISNSIWYFTIYFTPIITIRKTWSVQFGEELFSLFWFGVVLMTLLCLSLLIAFCI